MPKPSQQPQPVITVEPSPKLEQLRTQLPALAGAATASPRSGWEPVDASPLLDGTNLIAPPSVLHRDDGVAILYPGRINAFFGEPETLKTFVALFAAYQEMPEGHHVGYCDYEDSPESAFERLKAFGAKDDDIVRYFSYFASPLPVVDDNANGVLERLIDQKGALTLVVFDGVTEAMMASNLNPDNGSDVASFYAAAPRWFAAQGATVLLLDHVTKDRTGRGHWAIGSERKLSGLDGAAYTLKARKPFGRGRNAAVDIVIAKDRPGWVRQYQGQSGVIAIFEPRSLEDGKIEARLLPPEMPGEHGEFRPTDIMERASKQLEGAAPDPLNATAIRNAVVGNSKHIGIALQRLIEEGYVESKPGSRSSTLYWSVKPFQKGTPPPAGFAIEDDDDLDDVPLTKSGSSTGSVRFPYKEGGTRNESNRLVPGTTGNRSGTTTAIDAAEQNRGSKTPLARVHRVPIGLKAR